MKRILLVAAAALLLTGCQYAAEPAVPSNQEQSAQARAHQQVAQASRGAAATSAKNLASAHPEDPEMAELTALLGRPNVTAAQMAPAAIMNIRQHSFQSVGRDIDPSIDRTGRRMVFASTAYSAHSDIFVKDVDGQAITQLTTDPASDLEPVISPDGSLVAFTSNRSGNWEVYVMSIDGKSVRQVTYGGGENLHPSWSPDGTRLVYCCRSDRSGQWEMWIVHLLAPATRQFIGNGLFPVWSPAEEVIAYQRPRERGLLLYGIWTVRLANGEPSLPTLVASSPDTAYLCPTFSNDGSQIAFVAVTPENGPDATDIFCVDLNGDNLQRLTKGPGRKFSPTWAGDRIYFSFNRGGQENIWSVQVDGGPKVVATSTPRTRKTDSAVAKIDATVEGQ
jgi:Tol biopolymer transport system component